MKSTSILFLMVILLSCTGTNNSEVEDQLSLMTYEDQPCVTTKRSKIVKQNYLDSWVLNNDTLKLVFKFQNSCGSAYSEYIDISGHDLHITLTDTATQHARCVCEHTSICRVHILEGSQVGINLDIKFYAQNNYSNCLDTLITIR